MIKVLGAAGSYSHISDSTAFLIEKNIVIDAGNIIKSMGNKCCELEHIFITHTHFDHIVDLPFILGSYFECREKPLKIYVLETNLLILQKYLFNWSIWPNFEKIMNKNNTDSNYLELIPIKYGETITIDDIEITPIWANHTIDTCGFKIKKNNQSILFSGDTYINENLIDILNNDKTISSLLIDVSFSSEQEHLALTSKHLTPKLLKQMLLSLDRDDVAIYTYHQKPQYIEKIDQELADMHLLKNGGKRLETGDMLDLFSPKEKKQNVKNLELYYNDRDYLKNLFDILQTVQNKSNLTNTLDIIVDHTMKLTHADAAMLHFLNDKTQNLECKILYNHTLNLHENYLSYDQNVSCKYPYIDDLKPNMEILSLLNNVDKHAIIFDNIYDINDFDFGYIKEFDKKMDYHSKSMIIVPLFNHDNNKVIGIMQLLNKKNIYNENINFDNYDLESAKTLTLQASIAIANSDK